MSSFKTYKPHVRMVEKAGCGHGVGVHEAVAAATAQMEVLRSDTAVRVEAIMARLEALRNAGIAAASGEVRRLADELAGLCGVFGPAEVGSVASSLCRLLDLPRPAAANAAAVAVHLDALQLFGRMEAHARAQAAEGVLAGLRQVVSANEAAR